MSALVPVRTTQREPVKAVIGTGALAYSTGTPVWSMAGTPQRRAFQAAALYRENYLIRLAERPVSTRGGSVDWHLEDVNEDEITDESAPNLVAIRDLIERPQAGLPKDLQQPGMTTRRGMWTTTLRHTGLCGTTFWYLDQTEALAGTPLAILYIAPWRAFEVTDRRSGKLLGWTLDKSMEEGGTPLDMANVLPFYLEPPDQGNWAAGLVEAAGTKAMLDPLIDRHIANVLAGGGRLTGLISPKVGSVVSDDQWAAFVRDYRTITADPSAAQRLQIVKGAVDYVRTAATPDELSLVEIDERTRDAVLALWGVPRSQVGIAQPAGLNSGATKGYDEAVLWQGAIHPRLQGLYETIQYGLLDRYKATGVEVELVLEEPSFDDDAPLYEKAAKAQPLPLTRNERREIIGKEPLPDWDDQGQPNGVAIDLPIVLSVVGSGPSEEPRPAVPEPVAPIAAPPVVPTPPGVLPVQKADLRRDTPLRRSVERQIVPRVKDAVLALFQEQKASVIRYLRTVGLDHLRRKREFNWDAKRADEKLVDALKPQLGMIAGRVAAKTQAMFAGKAEIVEDFAERIVNRVLTTGAGRVRGINATTRTAVQEAISGAIADAETIDDIIRSVEELDIFGELRAETIARTESMFAYNDASLSSFGEYGVTEVQAIDGDGDPECAERDGQTFSLEEAEGIEDHPNGTLDWVPIVPNEPPAKATVAPPLMQLEVVRSDAPAPIVTVEAPVVNVEAPIVNVAPPDTEWMQAMFAQWREEVKAVIKPQPMHKRVVRDAEGRIVEVIEVLA